MSSPRPSLRDATAEAPAPVRAVANAIAQYIDRLGTIWVEGQVAQISRRAGMATVFMTLRDQAADISIPLTCSRVYFDGLSPAVVEGASVVVLAKPSYYANRGSLSLQVREIRAVGLGELLARLEQRRQLLAAEGLFDQRHKAGLPFLPRRIGLVTAPNSAAERDVLENTQRRWPAVQFEVAYAAMQGTRCVVEVMEALDRLERHPDVEVIVVARGGGSVEDLLPFSDEALVRHVYTLTTPVVSAIGHEPDQPLLDLVADLRASTPTDAAKQIVPDVEEERAGIAWSRERLGALIRARIDREQEALKQLRSRPVLADPTTMIDARGAEVADLRGRARRSFGHRLDRANDEIANQRARARALSPLETLRRGYAVVQNNAGQVISTVTATRPEETLSVRLADGRVIATTNEVQAEESDG